MKPQPCAVAPLRPSWHAYPGGNTLTAAGSLGAGEEVCSRLTSATAPVTLPAETVMFRRPRIRRLRHRPSASTARAGSPAAVTRAAAAR